ncbi:MAG: hypothetical protein ACFFHV_18905 [Promethearchaeota archaeon]
MQIINHLAEVLSKEINISATASRGLIKLAIKDEIGPFVPLNTLGLKDYQSTIRNSLKIRLQNLNVETFEEIIRLLLNELIMHQSLILMETI